jgi:general secretion pathway protein K
MIVGSRQSVVGRKKLQTGNLTIKKNSLQTADCRLLTDSSGIILIALLWILTALSLIALSFSKDSFVEVAAARNTQALKQSYFIARGGIDATIYRLLQKRMISQVKQAGLEEVPDPIDLGKSAGSLAGGNYMVDIQDESGKININAVSDIQLRALTEAVGIDPRDAEIITDSILDWSDADKNHRLNGAEDDYYQSLIPPYKAKNRRFDTLEELLLVRGVTSDYFYGHPERDSNGSVSYRYGLYRCFTVYSNRNQININFAPLPVLLSIPGMPPEAARLIYERRKEKPFKNLMDISRELSVSLGTSTMPLLTVNPTYTYTLTVSAHAANSKALCVIRTVIALEPGAKKPYRTLYWNENVPDYEGIQQ